jgi:hypothetical protein
MRKKVLFTVVVLLVFGLFIAWGAQAKPFIVCDPQAGVQGYEITGIPGVPGMVAATVDGAIKYDLAGIPIGTYNATIKPCNVWDCGEAAVMPPFTKTVPVKPVNVRLSVE